MLTAHFDDSWNDDVFVVAGFIATAEDWAAFSDEWRLALDAPRGIHKFVANEAMTLRGEFHRFSTEERDRKLGALSGIIDRYTSLEVFIVMPVAMLKEEHEISGLPKIAGDPYYITMMMVIRGIASRQISEGAIEKINFIFDEKRTHQARIIEAWSSIAEQQSPEMQQIISRTPVFDSDDNILPLQAADWAAWRRRKQGGAEFALTERPWRRVPVLGGFLDRQTIRAFREIAAKSQAEML